MLAVNEKLRKNQRSYLKGFSITSYDVPINIHDYDNLHMRPLSKRPVSWHSFDIKFGTLGQLVTEVGAIL